MIHIKSKIRFVRRVKGGAVIYFRESMLRDWGVFISEREQDFRFLGKHVPANLYADLVGGELVARRIKVLNVELFERIDGKRVAIPVERREIAPNQRARGSKNVYGGKVMRGTQFVQYSPDSAGESLQ